MFRKYCYRLLFLLFGGLGDILPVGRGCYFEGFTEGDLLVFCDRLYVFDPRIFDSCHVPFYFLNNIKCFVVKIEFISS